MQIIFTENVKRLFEHHHVHFSCSGNSRFKQNEIFSIDESTKIEPYSSFNAGTHFVTMGAFSYSHSRFLRSTKLNIGRYCSIARGFQIQGTSHPIDRFTTSPVTYDKHVSFVAQSLNDHPTSEYIQKENSLEVADKRPVEIGNDVWIGGNVTISRGVSIGNGAIVGSNALVTKDVPDYAIVGGVPAKIIRYRFSEKDIADLNNLQWWNYAYWDFSGVEVDAPISNFIQNMNQKINEIPLCYMSLRAY